MIKTAWLANIMNLFGKKQNVRKRPILKTSTPYSQGKHLDSRNFSAKRFANASLFSAHVSVWNQDAPVAYVLHVNLPIARFWLSPTKRIVYSQKNTYQMEIIHNKRLYGTKFRIFDWEKGEHLANIILTKT